MIRVVWIAAMLCVLCIVLYVPSAVAPERIVEILRAVHAANAGLWGQSVANRILARMLDAQSATGSVATPPPATVDIGGPGVDQAMAREIGQMSTRLFGAPYFRAFDALMSLALFRASTILHVLPVLVVFLGVASIDGLVVRVVPSREFVAHSAELFTASTVVGIALFALMIIAAFLPFSLGPMYLIACLLLMLFVLSRAVANYHRIR